MISGRSAPSAAALTGFAGTRSTSHRENVGIFVAFCAAVVPALDALAFMDAMAAGSSGIRLISGGARSAAYAAAANSVTMKNTIAPRPTRPMDLAFGALVMPTIRLPTTSGITVIRMALIHSVPSGSIASAALARRGEPLLAMATPPPMPATSAMRTRVVRDMRQSRQRSGAARDALVRQ